MSASLLSLSICQSTLAVSFHWDCEKAMSNIQDVMRYDHWMYKTWAIASWYWVAAPFAQPTYCKNDLSDSPSVTPLLYISIYISSTAIGINKWYKLLLFVMYPASTVLEVHTHLSKVKTLDSRETISLWTDLLFDKKLLIYSFFKQKCQAFADSSFWNVTWCFSLSYMVVN